MKMHNNKLEVLALRSGEPPGFSSRHFQALPQNISNFILYTLLYVI
jgi:hypothetical protein